MTEPTFKRPELEDKEIISSYFEKAQSRSCELFQNKKIGRAHV